MSSNRESKTRFSLPVTSKVYGKTVQNSPEKKVLNKNSSPSEIYGNKQEEETPLFSKNMSESARSDLEMVENANEIMLNEQVK